MGRSTEIGWCDHTFNPWWGCVRVSPGCANCYAEAFAKRTGHAVWGKTAPRRFFTDKHWNEPLRWNAAAEAAGVCRRVFCASMADVFEENSELVDERDRLFDLIDATPDLDWLLLTKRPENIDRLAWRWTHGDEDFDDYWPENVWIGTTAEDQQRANERIPALLEAGAGADVRFVSCEPLLEAIDITRWLELGVDWVIVGGESGNGHRPFDPDWARALRDQCDGAGVPFFFKQHGGRTPKASGDLLDGTEHKAFPT